MAADNMAGGHPHNVGRKPADGGHDPVADKAAAITAERAHPPTWKSVVKRAVAVAVAGAAIYLVLPSLIAVLGSWPRLSTLNPVWFAAASAAVQFSMLETAGFDTDTAIGGLTAFSLLGVGGLLALDHRAGQFRRPGQRNDLRRPRGLGRHDRRSRHHRSDHRPVRGPRPRRTVGFSSVTAVANSVSRANQVKSGLPATARRTSTRGGAHDCPRPKIRPLPPG